MKLSTTFTVLPVCLLGEGVGGDRLVHLKDGRHAAVLVL